MTPGLLDPLKPYLWSIRIALYALLAAFLFVGGCNYGKGRSAAKVEALDAKLTACQADNREQTNALSQIASESEAYRRQSAQQAKDLAKAQSELKAAQKRADAETAELERMLKDAYAKNRAWADSAIPAEYRRLLNDKGQD